MSLDSLSTAQGQINLLNTGIFPRRALTIAAPEDCHVQPVTVYLYTFNPENLNHKIKVDFHKRATTEELIEKILAQRDDFTSTNIDDFEIYETLGALDGRTFKERRLDPIEYPVAVQTLWPRTLSDNSNEPTIPKTHGRTFKERRLDNGEYPVAVQTLWPRTLSDNSNEPTIPKTRFVMKTKGSRPQGPNITFVSTETSSTIDSFLAKFLTQPQDREYADLCMLPELTEQTLLDNLRDRFNSGHIYTYIGPILVAVNPTETSSTIDSFLAKFLTQPQDREYADLCMLPELTEQTLLDNLRDRFNSGHIYTYIGPILVAVNPFNFFPIYNPKYARLYSQSRRLGALPPHIFAIADITYHNMLRIKESQCVVISGESGSGKTESTNFLLHHLTTLSQKGSDGSSVEQTLLSAGPVLEAFGNAVTVQNNNSSRFGKFIKVNYRENGMVSG
uniref:Myosin motor domain-containing protein n=1 Tax=Panagrolaimus sp. ES5 TaxID=591445 RepID=A0AC34G8L4_9BILA